MKAASVVLLALVAAACSSASTGGGESTAAAPPPAAAEIRGLLRTLAERHPDPYRATPKEELERAADELVARLPALGESAARVGVMRLLALAGPRNGHTGVFPLGANARPFRLLPVQLYRFADGLFVIGELGAQGLVGSRVVEIAGRPLAEVEELVRPVVARDNDWDLAARLPEFLVTTDVLHGLGLVRGVDGAELTLERGGARRTVRLDAVAADAYASAFGLGGRINAPPAKAPRYLRLGGLQSWSATVDRGRAVVAAYNQTYGSYDLARALLRRAAGKKVRRVVVDLRLNQGGDNTQYSELLEALRRPLLSRGGRLRVLIGRHTYSAAGNLAADIDGGTRARLVGEPTGGSPSNWGDSVQVQLPSLGLTAYVATSWQPFGDEDALAVEPDVRVPLTSSDYFAGRDPVLEAALR